MNYAVVVVCVQLMMMKGYEAATTEAGRRAKNSRSRQ